MPKPSSMIPPPKFTGGTDQQRLVWMLQTISKVLDDLVQFHPVFLTEPLGKGLKDNWDETKKSLDTAIQQLQTNHKALRGKLKEVGMDGPKAEMKRKALEYVVNNLYQEVKTSPFSKWLKPTNKCINSILGSIARVIVVLEVPKEFKEQFEVALDVAELSKTP